MIGLKIAAASVVIFFWGVACYVLAKKEPLQPRLAVVGCMLAAPTLITFPVGLIIAIFGV